MNNETHVKYKKVIDERVLVTGTRQGEICFDLAQFETMGHRADTSLMFINRTGRILWIDGINEMQYKRIRKFWLNTIFEVEDYE